MRTLSVFFLIVTACYGCHNEGDILTAQQREVIKNKCELDLPENLNLLYTDREDRDGIHYVWSLFSKEKVQLINRNFPAEKNKAPEELTGVDYIEKVSGKRISKPRECYMLNWITSSNAEVRITLIRNPQGDYIYIEFFS
ncbi:MAG: hypothetical protein D3923_14855 [Candidatus Electrothrix sp. AR3]|nr:hypothetical protein [Candidatus Electrothrix sp. AR3]